MFVPFVDLKSNYLSIKKEIDSVIQRVIDSSCFIGGSFVRDFENSFAKYCHTRYAIGTSNGSSGLFMALKSFGVKSSDEIITVPNTFIATTEAIRYCGGRIRFVDVKYDTGLIDIEQFEKNITDKTRGVVVVDLYGQIPDMKHIREIADKHGLFVVEDACQSHGALYNGHPPGFYSDIACFSFFPSKNLGCMGDGGMVVTNNKTVEDKIRLIRNHGRKEKYVHIVDGFNFRLDGIQAGVLGVKLKYLDRWIDCRRSCAEYYDECLNDLVSVPFEDRNARHSYHLYVIKTQVRDCVKRFLEKQDIGVGIHYPIPLHLQPVYDCLGLKKGCFPVVESLSNSILSLPMFPELTSVQQDYVVSNVKKAINEV